MPILGLFIDIGAIMKAFLLITLYMFLSMAVSAQTEVSSSVSHSDNIISLTSEVNLSGANANYYNERGLLAEQQNNYQQALFYYDKAANMAPGNTVFLFNKGLMLQNLNCDSAAVEVFKALVVIDKVDFEAYIAMGISLGKTGRYSQAIKAFDVAERLRPSFKRIYYQRGIVKNMDGDYLGAEVDFNEAIRLEPEFVNAYYNRGVNYKDMNSWRTAIRDFDKVIAIDPNHGRAYFVRGVCYINLGDLKLGTADLKSAMQLGVNEAEVIYREFVEPTLR